MLAAKMPHERIAGKFELAAVRAFDHQAAMLRGKKGDGSIAQNPCPPLDLWNIERSPAHGHTIVAGEGNDALIEKAQRLAFEAIDRFDDRGADRRIRGWLGGQ